MGTVWIAWAGDFQATFSHCYQFEGNRPAIRHQAVETALEGLIHRVDPSLHLSHQGLGRETYFFAIFPKKHLLKAFVAQAHSCIQNEPCNLLAQSNFHMTLVYLGHVPPDFIQEVMRTVSLLRIKPFPITLDTFDGWLRPKVCFFSSKNTPRGLLDLVDQINSNMVPSGLTPERRSFKPHMTLARNWTKKITPKSIKPITWEVDEFSLVKSTSKKGGSDYEIIATWPLSGS